MSLLGSISKGATLKAAKKRVTEARESEGALAEQLYQSAYEGFSKVVAGDLMVADALYNWGFALLHEAKGKNPEQSEIFYKNAIEKFSYCLLSTPTHLGAAIDGGVAYMDLARANDVGPEHELYQQAMDFFNKADQIQKGSAAYNQACIHAIRGNKDACLSALQKSKEFGSMPEESEVLNDADMAAVRNEKWFQEFLGSVEVARVEAAENDRRTRRGLRKAEEIKLDLPPRPTDSVLRRHYDAMVAAELEKIKEMEAQKKREEEEALEAKKKEKFDYYQ